MKKTDSKTKAYILKIAILLAIAVFVLLVFMMNRSMPFINDDIWYSTNLVTGEKITFPTLVSDVWQSQVWHYVSWGGRSITHALLQCVLTLGELPADILNTVCLVLLSLLIAKFAMRASAGGCGRNSDGYGLDGHTSDGCKLRGCGLNMRTLCYALLAAIMLVAFNAASFMNMFWQAGAVNYLYSTIWIFGFVYLYVGAISKSAHACVDSQIESAVAVNPQVQGDQGDGLQTSGRREIPLRTILTCLGMTVLSLLTGWSNENMGPASCVLAIICVLYLRRKNRAALRPWMFVGILGSLVGSALVVLAPGNFVRSSLIKESFFEALRNHLGEMLQATFQFLFPIIILAAFVTWLQLIVFKQKLKLAQILLLIYFLLAHGAMFLSPTYPSRATFGVLAILVVYILSILCTMMSEPEAQKHQRYVILFGVATYVMAVISLVYMMVVPPL